jgi:hypothetical protein
MAKWLCRCENVLTTSGAIPNPDELYVMPAVKYDARADADDFDLITESFGAYRCPACARLWVFWGGYGNEPTVYALEEG